MNDDLLTVSWLLISFIINSIIVVSMEVYYILLAICETMLWMYNFFVQFLFVSSQNIISGSFLVCFYIFFKLEACMYTFPFIVGSNISTVCISISDFITLELVDSVSLISFTPGISMSSWPY